MHRTKSRNALTDTFHSWGDYLQHMRNDPVTWHGRLSSVTGDESFTGSASWNECLTLARDGWEEGAERVNALANVLVDRVTSLIEVPEVVMADEGTAFDMGLALDGEEECWFSTVPTYSDGPGSKVTRIVFNCIASAGISTKVIIARGSACLALALILEQLGRPVELVLACSDDGTGGIAEAYVTVKEAGDPLDVQRVAFITAHPSTLRRLMFRWLEQLPDGMSGRCSGGYGRCVEATDRGDIYFGMAMLGHVQWANPEAAIRWLLDEVRKQGFEID